MPNHTAKGINFFGQRHQKFERMVTLALAYSKKTVNLETHPINLELLSKYTAAILLYGKKKEIDSFLKAIIDAEAKNFLANIHDPEYEVNPILFLTLLYVKGLSEEDLKSMIIPNQSNNQQSVKKINISEEHIKKELGEAFCNIVCEPFNQFQSKNLELTEKKGAALSFERCFHFILGIKEKIDYAIEFDIFINRELEERLNFIECQNRSPDFKNTEKEKAQSNCDNLLKKNKHGIISTFNSLVSFENRFLLQIGKSKKVQSSDIKLEENQDITKIAEKINQKLDELQNLLYDNADKINDLYKKIDDRISELENNFQTSLTHDLASFFNTVIPSLSNESEHSDPARP